MNQILAILAWWLGLELVGWAAWPLTATFLRATASRGAAFARHLGLLLTGYLLWLAASLGVLENTRVAILLVIALVAAASVAVSRREGLARLWRAQRRDLLVAELVFLAAFLAYLAFRAYDPSIDHTEKPMDFGFLNAILRSRTFPPHDMWLSGYAISYYYFGYLLMAVLTRLSGVPSGLGYNLALGTVFALTVLGAYGLVRDLAAGLGRVRREVAGAAGAVFVAVVGNLEGLLELLHTNGIGGDAFWRWVNIPALRNAPANPGWLPGTDWWWWRATRLIQDNNPLGKLAEVITEFPAFSFILGDLHPHVMALPFGLLALAVAWHLLRSATELPPGAQVALRPGWELTWPALPALGFLVPLVVGALGFMNSWDLPTYAFVAVAAYAIGRAWRYGRPHGAWASESGLFAVVVLLGGIGLYLPFYIGFRSQAGGLQAVFYAKTPWLQYLLIFGLFLAVLVPWIGGQALGALRRGRAPAAALAALCALPVLLTFVGGGAGGVFFAALSVALQSPLLIVALAVTLALGAALLWSRLHARPEAAGPGATFALLLACTGLLLTYGTEFVFIKDSFGTRMNTMFKFYYQAWVLLGVAAAWGVGELLRRAQEERQVRAGVWLGAVGLLLLAGLYYPAAAATSKAGLFRGRATLDGTAWLDRRSGEGAAIAWLDRQVQGAPVILEAPGDEYNPAHNRVSAWTGLPTVLGWAGHEGQWRGNYDEASRRGPDIAAIYQARDPQRAAELLARYQVEYVYVGPYERQKYGLTPANLAVLDRLLDRVYDRDGVIIYRRRP